MVELDALLVGQRIAPCLDLFEVAHALCEARPNAAVDLVEPVFTKPCREGFVIGPPQRLVSVQGAHRLGATDCERLADGDPVCPPEPVLSADLLPDLPTALDDSHILLVHLFHLHVPRPTEPTAGGERAYQSQQVARSRRDGRGTLGVWWRSFQA